MLQINRQALEKCSPERVEDWAELRCRMVLVVALCEESGIEAQAPLVAVFNT